MSPDPTLLFADGPVSIGSLVDPLLVDPSPSLLTAVIEAYREAAPALVDPTPPMSTSPAPSLPSLTVLATDEAVDAVTARFHPASRLAAIVDADGCELLSLRDPQPNPVLAGRSVGYVLVPDGDPADSDAAKPTTWRRVGDDPALRERSAPLLAEADRHRLRTPSRGRVHTSVSNRCGDAVADDVLRALDVESDRGDSLDRSDARRRAYAVGARHGVADRDIRRACEDAGLGSAATFTRIKGELSSAGLLDTEPVAQPVGRPRDRLVARGALAEADGPETAVRAVAAGLTSAEE